MEYYLMLESEEKQNLPLLEQPIHFTAAIGLAIGPTAKLKIRIYNNRLSQ